MKIILISAVTVLMMILNKIIDLKSLFKSLMASLVKAVRKNYLVNAFIKFPETVFKTVKMSVSGRKFVKVFAI